MKIQLDYDLKTITLEADCELKEFIPVIQRILPDWQKWTLKTEVITNWINPVTYPYLYGTGTPLLQHPYTTSGTHTGEINKDGNMLLRNITCATTRIVNIDVN